MNYWIIADDGKTYGPADLATLRRWVAEGRALPESSVARAEHGPWSELRALPELAELFPATAGTPPTSPGAIPTGAVPAGDWPPGLISIPLLVSGIINIVAGLAWCSTCIGIVLGGPLIALGIVELVAYSKARSQDAHEWLGRAKTLAILDACTILTGNIASCTCGIIVLTQLDSARMQLSGRRP
jgi:hypothetical protein